MMFCDRLKLIMDSLDVSCTELSRYVGIDRSSLSRLRCGKRVPSPYGSTINKLVNGIFLCASELSLTHVLAEISGIDPHADPKDIKQAVYTWLIADYALSGTYYRDASGRLQKASSFAARLDNIMKLADISNADLGRLLHVDPSQISRYRTGVRSPRRDTLPLSQLTDILWQRIDEPSNKKALSKLIRIPVKELDRDYLHMWLNKADKAAQEAADMAERLLDALDTFPDRHTTELNEPDHILPDSLPEDDREIYRGINGLREAVIRFLTEAALSETDELCLYSDQNMDWMLEDATFRTKWAALMAICVRKGIRIRIIHNIDRDLDEMNNAIISWLPLYMSGMIESYYCIKPESGRFSHTVFLCPGRSCISSYHSVGGEDNALYHYYTDNEALSSCRDTFDRLLSISRHLMRVVPESHVEDTDGRITIIQKDLSVVSMPSDLVDSPDMSALRQVWDAKEPIFIKHVQNHSFYECLPVQSILPVSDTSPSPEEQSEAPAPVCSDRQYLAHAGNILRLMRKYPNYTIYPIPETPFSNIDLVIGDSFVKVTLTEPPYLTFFFTHPLMCLAFNSFAEKLRSQCVIDRETLLRELEKRCSSAMLKSA